MPLTITTTKRGVKNGTGMDVSVTSYEQAASAKQVKNYHVVVITKLPFFKLAQHSEDDVVQFMVPRDYSAFEKLQREMLVDFPELKLPSFPRKFHVFMDETDIEERMVSFDCIVKIIARHKTMCTAFPMLEFLGFELLSDRKYFKARRQYLQKKEEEAIALKKKNEQVFGEEEVDQEFFGAEDSTKEPFDNSQRKPQQLFADTSMFDENGGKLRKSTKVSLVKDREEDIFLPGGESTENSQAKKSSLLDQLEDNSDLLNVQDSLDDVLKISESKKPSAKKVAPVSSSGARGLFEVEETSTDTGMSDMGTDDIMKYIQQNQAVNDDDFDLF